MSDRKILDSLAIGGLWFIREDEIITAIIKKVGANEIVVEIKGVSPRFNNVLDYGNWLAHQMCKTDYCVDLVYLLDNLI